MNITDVLTGYEARLTELRAGLRLARLHHVAAVVVLVGNEPPAQKVLPIEALLRKLGATE